VYVFVSEPRWRNEATDFLGGSRTTDTPNVFAVTVPEKTRLAADAERRPGYSSSHGSTVCSEVRCIVRFWLKDCTQHRPTLIDQKNQPCECEKRKPPHNSGGNQFLFRRTITHDAQPDPEG